jgi:hypothetical protein
MPAVLLAAVVAGAIAGFWGLLGVLIVAVAIFAWLRLRQLTASGERDEVSYTRLSDLLRRRR